MKIQKVTLVKFYNDYTFTHHYLFGVHMFGHLYGIPMTLTDIDGWSRLSGDALRVRLDMRACKRAILSGKAYKLMTLTDWTEYAETFNAETRLNKGYAFEKAVCDHFGLDWSKDDTPFWAGADVTINGIGYQLKYGNNATYTDSKKMDNHLNK